MQTKLHRQSSQTLYSIGLSTALGFAVQIICARALGASGKGIIDLLGASSGLFILVLGGSLNVGVAHFVAKYQSVPDGLMSRFVIWALIAGMTVVVILGASPTVARGIGLLPKDDSILWIGYLALITIAGVWSLGLRGILMGCDAVVLINRMDLAVKSAQLLAFMVLALSGFGEVKVFAVIILSASIALPVWLFLNVRGPTQQMQALTRKLLVLSIPVHGANILAFLNQRSVLFFLQAGSGSHEVAVYSVAMIFAQLVLTLSAALAQPLLAAVSAATNKAQASIETARACRRYLLVAVAASTILGLTVPSAITPLFGDEFMRSGVLIVILLPGMIAMGVSNILDSFFVGTNNNRYTVLVSATALASTMVGNVGLIASFGATGAAIAATTAYTIAGSLASLLFIKRTCMRLDALLLPTRQDFREAWLMVRRGSV